MDNTWLSILPPVITIVIAIWSKRIIPSLLVGLLIGSYLLHPTITGGIETALDKIVDTLTNKDNVEVLLFLYLFSGLIGLIKKSGGIKAFSDIVQKHVKSEKGVLFILWALIPVTFIDCDFRIVGTGSIISSLAEKNKMARERLAFMLNNTASPIVELIPVATTFVGFNIAVISQGLETAGILKENSGYTILLKSIPFEFFSIVIIFITFGSIFFEYKKSDTNNNTSKRNDSHAQMDMDMNIVDIIRVDKPRVINLIIPMACVIFFSFFFFWFFGKDGNSSLVDIITNTEPNKAMLMALWISITISALLYFFQKYRIKEMTTDIISGGNEIISMLIILVIAWPLAKVSQDLGLSIFVQDQLSGSLVAWSAPVLLFFISSIITYFIGESWGAASLIMPFAIPLAVSVGADIPLCVAAVISGGTFGDTTSPVSGMSNMASNVAHADHIKYLKYAAPYNLAAAGIAGVLFLIAGVIFS